MNIEETLKLAVEHHQAGRLLEAHKLYQQVLAEDPAEPDALRLLGQLQFSGGNYSAAEELVRKAISLRPGVVDFHIDLGRICSARESHADALTAFTRAVQIDPFESPDTKLELARALSMLGRWDEAIAQARLAAEKKPAANSLVMLGEILLGAGRIQEAVDRLQAAVRSMPENVQLHAAYATALQHRGDFDLAEAEFRKAIELDSGSPDLMNLLGHLLVLRRRFPEAILELRNAIELRPEFPQAHLNLALAFTGLGQTKDSLASYRTALEQQPRFPQAWEGLGRVLMDLRQYTAAVAAFTHVTSLSPTASAYRMLALAQGGLEDLDASIKATLRAVELEPNSAEAHEALGHEFRWTGRLEEALVEFRRAIELNPRQHTAHSNLIYTLLAMDGLLPRQILDEHIEWARQQTASITPLRRPRNNPAPDRRLRIGYISNNFRDQAVSAFVFPIIRNHNRTACEICCYSDLEIPDQITGQYREMTDLWQETSGLSDEQLARKIREDRIDILVELTGHIGKGRLRALAYRPAPVQISYIGYQGTTGLAAVDYVLTDDWTDPPGHSEANYVEKPYRLPGSFFVYQPPGGAPPVGPLPARSACYVTFGCLNAVWKATARSVKLWARVMSEVPGSKMILLTTRCEETNRRLLEGFARGGIAPDRIQLVQRATAAKYILRYGEIDIALDPVPFNGHTTTCDAAWMGCPTVTLSGEIYAHRYGGSVLRNLNLPELATESESAYISAAVGLARDLDRLATLRATLRSTMQDSLITNGFQFTKNLEKAYRTMWREWCAAEVQKLVNKS